MTPPGTTEKDCCRTLRHEPGHALDCTGLRCHICGSESDLAVITPAKSLCADCVALADQP